jgi:hypothetical protein
VIYPLLFLPEQLQLAVLRFLVFAMMCRGRSARYSGTLLGWYNPLALEPKKWQIGLQARDEIFPQSCEQGSNDLMDCNESFQAGSVSGR